MRAPAGRMAPLPAVGWMVVVDTPGSQLGPLVLALVSIRVPFGVPSFDPHPCDVFMS